MNHQNNAATQIILKLTNRTTLETIITEAKNYNIEPSVIAQDKKQNNVVIFQIDEVITSDLMIKMIYVMFFKLISGLDKSSQSIDISDLTIITELKDKQVTFEHLYITVMTEINKSSQKSRDLKNFIQAAALAEYNKQPVVFFGQHNAELEKQPNVYVSTKNSPIRRYNVYTVVFDSPSINHSFFDFLDVKEKKVTDYNELEQSCMMFEIASEGYELLDQNEMFGLFSNLNKMKGSKQVFEKIITSREKYKEKEKEKEIRNLYNEINSENYGPVKCSKYCKYKNECQNPSNDLLNRLTKAKNVITQVNEIEYRDINDIYNDMQSDLKNIITSETAHDGLYLVKAPTGAGKTSAVINILANTNKTVTMAFPTHRLKNEVAEKMTIKGVESVNIPEQPIIKNEELANKIAFLNAVGASTMVQKILRAISYDPYAHIDYADDIDAIRDYINMIDMVAVENKNVLLTHNRSLFAHTSNDIIVIDEDILLKAMLTVNTVNFLDLVIIMSEVQNKITDILQNTKTELSEEKINGYKEALEYVKIFNSYTIEAIRNSNKNKTIQSFFNCEPLKYIISALDGIYNDIGLNSNVTDVIKFLSSDYYTINNKYDINYSSLNHFQQNYRKIIVLSATYNEQLYRDVFKNKNIIVRDYGNAKPSDRIQITNKSFSRASIKSDDMTMRLARKLQEAFNPGSETITYKSQSHDNEIHYGATEGIDILAGRDITVIGTPHVIQDVYNLYYSAVYDEEVEFSEIKYIKVQNEFYEFWFSSFESAKLRNIQMYVIESEIEQAAGRGRDLRYNCRTLILSNYPTLSSQFIFLSNKELAQYK